MFRHRCRGGASGLVILGAFAAAFCPSTVEGQILYVDDDAPLGGDGQTWDTAFRYLQDALFAAADDPGITEIRVGQGTYKPDQDEAGNVTPGDREATFQLVNGVALEGGYAGVTEPDPDARDIELYRTILNGDLAGDDGPNFENYGENSYHVVTAIGTDDTTVLGSFTITAGNADGTSSAGDGGGIYSDDSALAVIACFLRGNRANRGGGISVFRSRSTTLAGCRLAKNVADFGGGLASGDQSSVTLSDCVIADNIAQNGGGIYSYSSEVSVRDCVLVGNWALNGGGMSNYSGRATVINCLFNGNSADFGFGGGLYNEAADAAVVGCRFVGNRVWLANEAGHGGGIGNWEANASLVGCLFAGNYSYGTAPAVASLFGGQTTLAHCTVSGNVSRHGAAIRNLSATMALDNCTVWDGSRDQIEGPASVSYSCIKGGWDGVGNIDADPLFRAGPSGTWTEPGAYDPETYRVVLTDAAAEWDQDDLVGKLINPDLDQWAPIELLIVANTANTITIWADRKTISDNASWVEAGANYEVHDYRLQAISPCIDAADDTAVPLDEFDLDKDGDTAERLPLDLDGDPRFVDDPYTDDTGVPDPPDYPEVVDMGAYEFQPCPGDLNGDGCVDQADLGILLAHWGCTGGDCPGDIDRDGQTGQADLGILLANWGAGCG